MKFLNNRTALALALTVLAVVFPCAAWYLVGSREAAHQVADLTRNADLVAERLGMRINLKWVCDKDESRLKGLPIPTHQLTADAQKVLQDSDLHVVIHVIRSCASRS